MNHPNIDPETGKPAIFNRYSEEIANSDPGAVPIPRENDSSFSLANTQGLGITAFALQKARPSFLCCCSALLVFQ